MGESLLMASTSRSHITCTSAARSERDPLSRTESAGIRRARDGRPSLAPAASLFRRDPPGQNSTASAGLSRGIRGLPNLATPRRSPGDYSINNVAHVLLIIVA